MAHEIANEWFKFADLDLAAAQYLQDMQPQPLEIICYHCQQAAEKYLKGFLIYRGVAEPPKTHNLDTLCELCLEYDERFQDYKRACLVLTMYGVQPRYPYEMGIDAHDMKKALDYACQIKNAEPLAEIRNYKAG